LWGRESVKARRGTDPGQYLATLSLQDTGQLVITIDANWHTARTTLLPLRVVSAGTVAAAVAPEDRGRDLFVARGCVSCHMKRDDRQLVGRNDAQVGPDLTGRGFAKEWLVTKLADPARNRVQYNEHVRMPDLGLSEREIAALVSYINRPQSGTASDNSAPKSGS
jgi:mono/diheme cytochrome c family protein